MGTLDNKVVIVIVPYKGINYLNIIVNIIKGSIFPTKIDQKKGIF